MASVEPRLLFIPVSGAFGMGEYARSLAIAYGVQAQWPEAQIHFMLSRRAPYAAGSPFPKTLLDSSATFHSAAVIDLIASWRPDVVIFDNAGRSAQLRAAARSGARVVYISARRRQRSKAFRLRWMRRLDEHWIAYPRFIAGDLGWLERLKLRLVRRTTVRFLDVIMSRHMPSAACAAARAKASAAADAAAGCVLVVPGGGTGHPGAEHASLEFLQAARLLAARGAAVVFVGSVAAGAAHTAAATPGLTVRGALPQTELAALMGGAQLIVANGGATLLQAIASNKPCIAVPIAGDQAERIRACVAAGVAVAAPLSAAAIAAAAADLLDSDARRAVLLERIAACGLQDGVAVAVAALRPWLDARTRTPL